MKKVLVMGGSYFIGKKIVDILLTDNYDVFTLNRGSKEIDNKKITNLICDRNDEKQMKSILKNYEFNIIIDVSGLNKNQAEILLNSINKEKLEAFVFISSSAVYDTNIGAIPFKENHPLKANEKWNEYGQNKIEAESYYTKQFTNTHTKLIILRPPYVYGENNYAQRESFIFHHIENDKPILVPSLNTKLQFIYTTGLANIITTLINKTASNINIYNVGNKNTVTVKEWIECCEKAVGKKSQIIEYDYKKAGISEREFFPFFDYDNILDVNKINQVYADETNFMEGLKTAYDWYCLNKNSICFKENVTKNEERILKEMETNVIIRECAISDINDIVLLNKEEMGYDFPLNCAKEKLEALLNDTSHKIFVAAIDDKIIGYVHANNYDLLYAPSLKNIMGIAVSNEYKRMGIGKKLLKTVETWAHETNASGIRLASGINRTGTHEFYKSCGYSGDKQQIRFVKMFE